jgi:hypothetical protein
MLRSAFVSDTETHAGLEMTSVSLAPRKPRRKWGWIFVVAFALQAIAFTVLIDGDLTKANEWRGLAQRSLDSQDPKCDYNCKVGLAALSNRASRLLDQEANMLMITAAVLSVGTLIGAFFGLRRRQ